MQQGAHVHGTSIEQVNKHLTLPVAPQGFSMAMQILARRLPSKAQSPDPLALESVGRIMVLPPRRARVSKPVQTGKNTRLTTLMFECVFFPIFTRHVDVVLRCAMTDLMVM